MVNHSFYKTHEQIFQTDPGFPLKARIMLPQTVTVPHQHEFTECIFVIGGKGIHQCGTQAPTDISRGDILVIPPGGKHAYVKVKELSIINLLFDTSRLPPVLLELYSHPVYKELFMCDASRFHEKDFPRFTPAETNFNELEFLAIRLAKLKEAAGNHCYKLGIFMALLSQLCNAGKIAQPENANVPLDIPKLTAFLECNFQRDVYLDELTRLAAMSRSTLIRHFRAALGTTPMEYLRDLRLRHAAELLLNTMFSIKEISDRSGFPSAAYFFRAFKARYGTSPLLFRSGK